MVGIDYQLANEATRAVFASNERELQELAPGASARFVAVPCRVEESASQLRKAGIKRFDIVTMFNPGRVYEQVGNLPKQAASALFLAVPDTPYGQQFASEPRLSRTADGAGASYTRVTEELRASGYGFLFAKLNPHIETMWSGFGFRYNPVIVAKR